MRTFTLKPAVRTQVPLLLGIVGASSSGKTYSALRLATGMAKVFGDQRALIAEAARQDAELAASEGGEQTGGAE